MLADILAIVVGASSLYLLSTAFIAADSHRKDDFLWGAVGLFYALVLWLSAGRIAGALLLGQTAATALVLTFGWQTLKLRQALLYPDRPIPLFSAVDWLGSRIGKVTSLPQPKAPVNKVKEPSIEKATEKIPETVPPVAPTASETVEPIANEGREALTSNESIDDPLDNFEDFEDDLEFDDSVTEAWDRRGSRDDDITEPMIWRVPQSEESEPAIPTEEVPVTDLSEITATLEENSPSTLEISSENVISPDPVENLPDQS